MPVGPSHAILTADPPLRSCARSSLGFVFAAVAIAVTAGLAFAALMRVARRRTPAPTAESATYLWKPSGKTVRNRRKRGRDGRTAQQSRNRLSPVVCAKTPSNTSAPLFGTKPARDPACLPLCAGDARRLL